MKKTDSKTALFLFAALLSVSLGVSCGDSASEMKTESDNSPSAAPQTDADAVYRADYLPEANYNGYQFRIAAYDEYPADIEEPSANIVDQSIYERNTRIEERYNITILQTSYPYAQYNDVNQLLTNAGLAQSDDYDLFTVVHRHAHSAILEGYVPPASQLPIVDLTQPWYLTELNRSLTIDGLTLLAYTAFDKNPGGSSVIFNQRILADLQMGDPYEMVDNGTWTYEVMYEMAAAAVSDLDGNGKMEEGDRFGIISEWDNLTDLVYRGSGQYLADFSGSMPELNHSESLVDVFSLAVQYTQTDGFLFDPFTFWETSESSRYLGNQKFMNGGSLFLLRGTDTLTYLGGMEDDYGIVPFPKWTEGQETYYVGIDGSRIAVPLACSADLTRVCVIKEALAAESLNTVYPAYYENALKNRYVRDEDAIRMLEIITSSNTFDLGASIWSDTVRAPWMNCLKTGKTDFLSAAARMEKSFQKSAEQLMNQIAVLKEND